MNPKFKRSNVHNQFVRFAGWKFYLYFDETDSKFRSEIRLCKSRNDGNYRRNKIAKSGSVRKYENNFAKIKSVTFWTTFRFIFESRRRNFYALINGSISSRWYFILCYLFIFFTRSLRCRLCFDLFKCESNKAASPGQRFKFVIPRKYNIITSGITS